MKRKRIIVSTLILILLLSICLIASGCWPKDVTETPTLSSPNFVFEKVVNKVLESTVRITCRVSNGTQGGSGVIVSTDGYVLTNYHVVKGAINNEATIKITSLSSKYETIYEAEILSEIEDNTSYSKMDLAVLKIKSFNSSIKGFTPVSLKSDKVTWGEYGVIIGNPKQLGTYCAHAMVSNPSRKVTHGIKQAGFVTDFITLDAPVNPGNSGGGFFDASGKLAGIVTLRQDNKTEGSNKDVIFGIGYAIPADSIRGYLARYKIKL